MRVWDPVSGNTSCGITTCTQKSPLFLLETRVAEKEENEGQAGDGEAGKRTRTKQPEGPETRRIKIQSVKLRSLKAKKSYLSLNPMSDGSAKQRNSEKNR